MGYAMSTKKLEDLCREAGWTEQDGPIPGVYKDRQPGFRCLWSVIWWTSDGMVDPNSISPNTPEADQWELEDLKAQPGMHERAAAFIKGDKQLARGNYREYCWPYDTDYEKLIVKSHRGGGWAERRKAPERPDTAEEAVSDVA